ncbi:MAG: hypothetical protein ACYTDX_04455, partial [Planctomycetota bacterium]
MRTGTWFDRIRRVVRGRLPAVAIGRRLAECAPGTWVLFPRLSATLPCGLAGIVQVAGGEGFRMPAADVLLSSATECTAVSVASLVDDGASLVGYAGGEQGASALLELARSLRRPGSIGHGEVDAMATAAAQAGARVREFCESEQAALDDMAARLPSSAQEAVASRLILLFDAAWALEREFLVSLEKSRRLCGSDTTTKRLVEMRKVNATLDAIDRIEVRGRDSAGLVVQVAFPSCEDLDSFRDGLSDGARADWADREGARDLLDG